MKTFILSLLTFMGITSAHASDFRANVEANQKTIQALIDNGSDPKKPHPLEHHFYCHDAAQLKALLKKGEALGYKAANMGDNVHEGEHYWYADLIKETVLDLKLINKENVLMLKLAAEFEADYDGWGTPVVE